MPICHHLDSVAAGTPSSPLGVFAFLGLACIWSGIHGPSFFVLTYLNDLSSLAFQQAWMKLKLTIYTF